MLNKSKYDGVSIKAERVIARVQDLIHLSHLAAPMVKENWKGDLRIARTWNIDLTQQVMRRVKIIFWEPPLAGKLKLNTDGAFLAQNSQASCGGIIRDHNGNTVLHTNSTWELLQY